MFETDFNDRARYLLTHGYLTGYTEEQLAAKLLKIDAAGVKAGEGVMTRAMVYGEDNVKLVETIVNSKSPQQKQLITGDERTSAALGENVGKIK